MPIASMFASPFHQTIAPGFNDRALGNFLLLADDADAPLTVFHIPPIFAPARITQPSAMIALRIETPFSITTSGMITLSMTSAPLPTVQPVEMTECSIMP